MGDYAKAEPLYRQALEITQEGAGREPPRLCHQPEQPGPLYQDMGDYARAEPLCRQALEIRRKPWARTTPTMPKA